MSAPFAGVCGSIWKADAMARKAADIILEVRLVP